MKKGTYRKWKENRVIKEEYRQLAKNYRDGIRRAKAENEQWLARDSKSNNNQKSILQICD